MLLKLFNHQHNYIILICTAFQRNSQLLERYFSRATQYIYSNVQTWPKPQQPWFMSDSQQRAFKAGPIIPYAACCKTENANKKHLKQNRHH